MSAINFLKLVVLLKPHANHLIEGLSKKTLEGLITEMEHVADAPELALRIFALVIDQPLNVVKTNLGAVEMIESLSVIDAVNVGLINVLELACRFTGLMESPK